MRQRIREIAASRNLSKEEIKPALSLKHYTLLRFGKKHGINWLWLYEGAGRMFRKDPITLSPNTSGKELSAVVVAMPAGDQRAIRAKAHELVQERDQ
jgi:hypothetical protein